MSLPAVVGVFCRSNLKTTGEIEKVSELGVGVAHSDADKGFPLVTPDELQGGAGFFPVFHQQIEGEGTTEYIGFGNPFCRGKILKATAEAIREANLQTCRTHRPFRKQHPDHTGKTRLDYGSLAPRYLKGGAEVDAWERQTRSTILAGAPGCQSGGVR